MKKLLAGYAALGALTLGTLTLGTLTLGTLTLAALTDGASAADLRTRVYKAAPFVAPEAFNWTGFYIGGNAGYAWTKSTDTVTAVSGAASGLITSGNVASILTLDPKGFIGGGQVGYNWQFSPMWVVGLETD